MITKKTCLRIMAVFFAIYLLSLSNVLAAEAVPTSEDNSEQVDTEQQEVLDETKKAQKQELISIIKELLEGMQAKLKKIDAKVEDVRAMKEYETYPAIRLNVDTPLFGLASVVNDKIKIKQEVSATDVASGYSIRSVIKNRSIKLPDFSIAGIIVGTRDVKLEESISLSDASASVLKLMQYTKNLDNTEEFLDNQINKVFKGYIPKDKTENIADMARRLNKLNTTLVEQDTNLIVASILSADELENTTYAALEKEFLELSTKIKNSQEQNKNILISSNDLNTLQRQVLDLEVSMSDFSTKLSKALETQKEKFEPSKVLISLKEELEAKQKKIDLFVDESVTKKAVDQKEPTEEQKKDENISDTGAVENADQTDKQSDEDTNFAVEEIKNYEVVSKNLVEVLKNDMAELQKKVDQYTKTNQEDGNEENNEEVIRLSADEKTQLLEEITKIYKDYLQKEDKFYLDNINFTLKATTSKIADVSKYTESDILAEMRYIYLELPEHLQNYVDANNMNVFTEIIRLSNSFHEELQKLISVYITVTGIYDELNVTEIKSKD